jgi:hypothetical protein
MIDAFDSVATVIGRIDNYSIQLRALKFYFIRTDSECQKLVRYNSMFRHVRTILFGNKQIPYILESNPHPF